MPGKYGRRQGLEGRKSFNPTQGLSSAPANTQKQSTDLFNSSSQKGDWYFYNQALRSRGSGEFKSRWGNRPNADNWRRAGAIAGAAKGPGANNAGTGNANGANPSDQPTEITYDVLYDRIPLTPEKLKVSNDSIEHALSALVNLYAEELEDCSSCVETAETLRQRFPQA